MFAAVLLAVLSACPSGKPPVDQGTVDACYLTIGVAVPGRDSTLGSTNGWRIAGQKAATDARHAAVRKAGQELVAALSADVVAGGFTKPEIAVYTAAVLAMEKGCKESGAFKGTPLSKLSPFLTPR